MQIGSPRNRGSIPDCGTN